MSPLPIYIICIKLHSRKFENHSLGYTYSPSRESSVHRSAYSKNAWSLNAFSIFHYRTKSLDYDITATSLSYVMWDDKPHKTYQSAAI